MESVGFVGKSKYAKYIEVIKKPLAIMFWLLRSNVDTLVSAKNARTSQGFIEQFYGSHLTTHQARRQLRSYLPVKHAKKKLEKATVDPADDDFNQD